MSKSKALVLDADLFGDAEMVRAAVDAMSNPVVMKIKPNEMGAPDWDDVLSQIFASDKIIVV